VSTKLRVLAFLCWLHDHQIEGIIVRFSLGTVKQNSSAAVIA
jgi:hypothetical protein